MKDASSFEAGSGLSQNELAYTKLKHRLTTLIYKPGEYLNTATLMADMALGRTPLNHALHRLATEGLVQIIPRKGVMVAPLSIDDALNMIDVRVVNECLCARLSARHITAAEITVLRATARSFDEAVAARDVARMMDCDRQFHEQIADASRNPVLIEVLRVLHARSQRFWAISLSTAGHVTEVHDEHQNILEALASGDADRAEEAVKFHILSFRQALLGRR
ncbi:GntR family transcriptional regulator [Diaphorobacter caeni]|uniref:GntR family transcriptional regulator n=1 Tax=Diaphorobacter caeni TaxID=2784387 RepID=UPI002B26F239|nr:GntR family transcriptional regulator [Diaphorobacter caeni]